MKDVTPVLLQWSYVFLALTYRCKNCFLQWLQKYLWMQVSYDTPTFPPRFVWGYIYDVGLLTCACTTAFKQHIGLEQNGYHFTKDIFMYCFLTDNFCIWVKIWLNFVAINIPNDNTSVMVQVIAWCSSGTTLLFEPMMSQLNDYWKNHQGLKSAVISHKIPLAILNMCNGWCWYR